MKHQSEKYVSPIIRHYTSRRCQPADRDQQQDRSAANAAAALSDSRLACKRQALPALRSRNLSADCRGLIFARTPLVGTMDYVRSAIGTGCEWRTTQTNISGKPCGTPSSRVGRSGNPADVLTLGASSIASSGTGSAGCRFIPPRVIRKLTHGTFAEPWIVAPENDRRSRVCLITDSASSCRHRQ